MAGLKVPQMTQPIEDEEEENLLDIQADIWMSFAVAMVTGGKYSSEGAITCADEMTEAYMDRFKNGLPGQDPPGSRSAPPPAPVKGRNPKAGDDD